MCPPGDSVGFLGQRRQSSRLAVSSLVLLVLCSLARPAGVRFAGGAGTHKNPYQIATAGQLVSIGSDPTLLDKHFLLLNDIDLDPTLPGGQVFTRAVIAPDTKSVSTPEEMAFTGSFDGNEHCIRNLALRSNSASHLGLFGIIGSEGGVTFLRIENATITGGENSRCLGALAGANRGTITNCRTTGQVLGEVQRDDPKEPLARIRTLIENPEFTGGLAGKNDGTVSNCYAVGTVSGGWRCLSAGGLVAMNGGDISNCYAEGEMIDGSESAYSVGGLVGTNGGTITHSYATARISAGQRTSRPGGLVGTGTGITTQCFWDTQVSGLKVSAGGTGLTTAQMMDPETYSRNGWAGNPNWVMDAGQDYPRLSWEGKAGRIIAETTLDWIKGSGTEYDPYIVSTAEQLAMIGKTSLLWDKQFILANDIDLDPNLPGRHVFTECVISPDLTPRQTITPKGVGLTFTGTFDGRGHTLYNLTFDNSEKPTSYVGLFGIVGAEGRAMNLGLVNVNIKGTTSEFQGGIGALAGYNLGSISGCYATGALMGHDDIGGLVGKNEGAIISCCTAVEVTGDKVHGIGGLVGCNQGTIANCYARGPVIGKDRCGMLGGLAGVNYRDGFITYCYATGSVSSGKGSFELGGFAGKNVGTAIKCLWDMETSGIRISESGMGLSTLQMMNPTIYSLNGWAGNPNWILDAGRDYPHLAWEGTPGKAVPEPTLTWLEGGGTEENPYLVGAAEQLALISTAAILWDKCFVLTSDLDLAGIDMRPIGEPGAFTGSFDGRNHVIRNLAMDFNGVPKSQLGLFGTVGSKGQVTNLGLEDVSITTSIGSRCCGALGGRNDGTITSCYVTGAVTGDDSLGGLVGANTGTITQCHATCTVTGTSNSWNVGGLVGSNTGDVVNCSAAGNVTSHDTSYNLGGLTGSNRGSVERSFATGDVSAGVESHELGGLTGDNKGAIANCYATGSVVAGEKSFPLAGLVASNGGTIRHCYSVGRVGAGRAVGGLVGTIAANLARSPTAISSVVESSIVGSFWDTETSGQQRSTGGAGMTTAKMQTPGTFLGAGWDFVNETRNGAEDIWWIRQGEGYPHLAWERGKTDAVRSPRN